MTSTSNADGGEGTSSSPPLITADMLYLPPEHWSPRYDAESYFTVQINSRQVLHQVPMERVVAGVSVGKQRFPGVYYEVRVRFGRHKRLVLRRYSQFKWLCDELRKDPPHHVVPDDIDEAAEAASPPPSIHLSPDSSMAASRNNNNATMSVASSRVETALAEDHNPLRLPPTRHSTCSFLLPQSSEEKEAYHIRRQEDLQNFCGDVLRRPGATAHPAVAAFFELEQCKKKAMEIAGKSFTSTSNNPSLPQNAPSSPSFRLCRSASGTIKFPFDIIVVTNPDADAAKAALSGPLRDLVRFLDEQVEEAEAQAAEEEEEGGMDNYSSSSRALVDKIQKRMPPKRYDSSNLDEEEEAEGKEEEVTDLGGDEEYLLSRTGVVILSTTDPFGARCGSGGGTVAALAHADKVHRKLKRAGAIQTKRDEEEKIDLKPPSVLIVHAGGDSSRCPTQMALGKAWTSLPICRSVFSDGGSGSGGGRKVEVSSPTQMLLGLLQSFMHALPPGGSVIVAAGDCLVSVGEGDGMGNIPHMSHFDESNGGVVLGLGVPAPLDTAKNHGVFIVREQHATAEGGEKAGTGNPMAIPSRPVAKFLQKPSVDVLKVETEGNMEGPLENKAWIDTGIVVFLPKAAQTLRLLGGFSKNEDGGSKISPILRLCTQKGLEELFREEISGEPPTNGTKTRQSITTSSMIEKIAFAKKHALNVDLYSHIMLALPTKGQGGDDASDMKEKYLGSMSKSLKVLDLDKERQVLSDLYDVLSTLSFQVCCVPQGQFCHLGTTRELLELQCFGVCNAPAPNDEDGGDDEDLADIRAMKKKCRDFGESCNLISRAVTFLREDVVSVDESSVVVNTLFNKSTSMVPHSIIVDPDGGQRSSTSAVGPTCVLEHCRLATQENSAMIIGSGCLLSGMRGHFISNDEECDGTIYIADDMVVQQTVLKQEWRALLGDAPNLTNGHASLAVPGQTEFVFGIMSAKDAIKSYDTVYGVPFEEFFRVTGVTAEDLWPSEEALPKAKRNLWNAFLHPVVSMEGDEVNVDPLFGWISKLMMGNATSGGDLSASVSQWKKLPRLSLQQIRAVSDAYAEYCFRHRLEENIRDTMGNHFDHCRSLLIQNEDLPCDTTPFVGSFLGGDTSPMFEFIDVLEETIQRSVEEEAYNVTSRCFMLIAGMLVDVARMLHESSEHMTKSDPVVMSSDDSALLEDAIELLRPKDTVAGAFAAFETSPSRLRMDACSDIVWKMNTLLEPAVKWHPPKPWSIVLNHIALMEACADYLEQAAGALTEVCICSMKIFTRTVGPPSSPMQWVVATAPGRIDAAGGWSDTPPISYENGGAVANLAVLVDGRKPLSARCRRTSEQGCLLVTEGRSFETGKVTYNEEARIHTLRDVSDLRDPSSKASLLKASLVCLGIVPRAALQDEARLDDPVQPYLDSFFGVEDSGDVVRSYGIELVSTSLLPRGSGMGGSSILAGCVLGALCLCGGVKIGVEDPTKGLATEEGTSEEHNIGDHETNLIHAVLTVEQLMTTGGGWQDQVGGLLPGLKIGRTPTRCIPMRLDVDVVPLPDVTLDELNERLILAFTGTQRLAKNLLLNVLRRWAHRTPEIVRTVKSLVNGAEGAITALAGDGDIDEFGRYMFEYWEQKKTMVGGKKDDENYGGEPPAVRSLLTVLKEKEEIVGGTLLGAGGGGFLVLLARKGRKGSELEKVAADLGIDTTTFSWHGCSVCNEGMRVVKASPRLNREESFALSWHAEGGGETNGLLT